MTDPRDPAERLALLEADNARLRRLLDGAGLPDSLRHGMRNTMAMLRTVMHRSADSAADVESYVAHLDGRFGAIMRVQAATDAFGDADLHTLISDELMFHLAREGEQASLAGPRVRLRPKAAQVVALALHELATNARKYGAFSNAHGQLSVRWRIRESDGQMPRLVLEWVETGIDRRHGTGSGAPKNGYGRELIENALPYALDATTRYELGEAEVRCLIELPLA